MRSPQYLHSQPDRRVARFTESSQSRTGWLHTPLVDLDHSLTKAFITKKRIIASIDPRNEASRRVLERLGFRHEGTMIESYWLGDTVTDDARFGLLRSEWEERRANA